MILVIPGCALPRPVHLPSWKPFSSSLWSPCEHDAFAMCQRRWGMEGVFWRPISRDCRRICDAIRHWIHLSSHDVREQAILFEIRWLKCQSWQSVRDREELNAPKLIWSYLICTIYMYVYRCMIVQKVDKYLELQELLCSCRKSLFLCSSSKLIFHFASSRVDLTAKAFLFALWDDKEEKGCFMFRWLFRVSSKFSFVTCGRFC